MRILLINNNPVVSRLTALSARKEEIEIDEIQEVTELSSDNYDIVFVDADSLSKDVYDIISEHIKVQKKVLFYAQDDKEEKELFDTTILKPFLPSEVSAVIRSVEENDVLLSEKSELKEDANYDVLADTEKREKLFSLDEDSSDISIAKEKEIKDELSTEEDSFDKQLEKSFPLKNIELEEDILDESTINNGKDISLKNKDDLFELDLNDDKLSLDEDLFAKESILDSKINDEKEPNEKKQMEHEVSLDDELLDLDFDKSDKVDLSSEKIDLLSDDIVNEEPQKEEKASISNTENKEVTKILDASEIANIKDILEEDTHDTMDLSELTAIPVPTMVDLESTEETVETKKKSNKDKETSVLNSEVSLETLANLPVESLRKLLAGADVNITIKFPKD